MKVLVYTMDFRHGFRYVEITPVILSKAKDLMRRAPRSFAEFTLERSEGLRMTHVTTRQLSGMASEGISCERGGSSEL